MLSTDSSPSSEIVSPRLHVTPARTNTLGDLAGRFAGDYGLTPDPWQQLILNDWLARTDDGKWSSLTCGLSVARQNGKNAVLEMRELFGTVGLGEKILHTAHQVPTARKHFKRLKEFFGNKVDDPRAMYPELNALVAEIRNTNGQEGIFLKNGGSIEIAARSGGAGRGWTVDLMVFDESQRLGEDDLEALLSTSSAPPKGNPQWFYTGTPPAPKDEGEAYTRVRDDALGIDPFRTTWHEWSPEPGADPDDRRVWVETNPGLASGRLLFDVVIGERARFSDDGFWRERLGGWAVGNAAEVIDRATWAAAGDTLSRAVDRLVLGVDVSPDRMMASVSLAGLRADGLMHIELDETRAGTGWLPAYIAERCARNTIDAVIVDGAGPAGSLIDELTARKVRVQTTSAREMAAACGRFYDAVMEGELKHTDQPQVTAALQGARRRPLGDAWAWNRKNSTIDITPLVSGTLAVWGIRAVKVKTRKNRPRRVLALS